MLQVFGVERKSRQQSKCYLGSKKRSRLFWFICRILNFKHTWIVLKMSLWSMAFFWNAHLELLWTSAFSLLQISGCTQGKDAKLASWAAWTHTTHTYIYIHTCMYTWLWYSSEKRWYVSDLSTCMISQCHFSIWNDFFFRHVFLRASIAEQPTWLHLLWAVSFSWLSWAKTGRGKVGALDLLGSLPLVVLKSRGHKLTDFFQFNLALFFFGWSCYPILKPSHHP